MTTVFFPSEGILYRHLMILGPSCPILVRDVLKLWAELSWSEILLGRVVLSELSLGRVVCNSFQWTDTETCQFLLDTPVICRAGAFDPISFSIGEKRNSTFYHNLSVQYCKFQYTKAIFIPDYWRKQTSLASWLKIPIC